MFKKKLGQFTSSSRYFFNCFFFWLSPAKMTFQIDQCTSFWTVLSNFPRHFVVMHAQSSWTWSPSSYRLTRSYFYVFPFLLSRNQKEIDRGKMKWKMREIWKEKRDPTTSTTDPQSNQSALGISLSHGRRGVFSKNSIGTSQLPCLQIPLLFTSCWGGRAIEGIAILFFSPKRKKEIVVE